MILKKFLNFLIKIFGIFQRKEKKREAMMNSSSRKKIGAVEPIYQFGKEREFLLFRNVNKYFMD
jgi:hypothetical protein